MLIKKLLNEIENFFERKIQEFQSKNQNQIFNEILEYSLLKNPGKKLRPLIATIFGKKYFQLKIEQIENFLIGIELIHTYSLVHDDLPALDNDDFRRGLPTIHKKFGEYNAILFGDGLQSIGFNFFSKEENVKFFEASQILKTINFFANIIGPQKLIYGQNLDLEFSKNKKNLDIEMINKIHKNKTAGFFGFCASFPGILIDSSEEKIKKSYDFGENFGLAFQILDDIEDFQDPEKFSELNILRLINLEKAKKILNNHITLLKNFIKIEIEQKDQEIFFELLKFLKY